MKINREIRAPKVRLIDQNGEQVGIVAFHEALSQAEAVGLDLVEVVPGAVPPVCKIMNYGKFRYDQTKKEKENKKAQHQVKIKEIKIKPNIDSNDLATKTRHARKFISEGNKVKLTCVYRGREMVHPEIGERLVEKVCQDLEDVASTESPPKLMGRFLTVVIAPAPASKKKKEVPSRPTPSEASATSEAPEEEE